MYGVKITHKRRQQGGRFCDIIAESGWTVIFYVKGQKAGIKKENPALFVCIWLSLMP